MKYRLRLNIADLPFEIITDHRLIARFLDTYFAAFRSDKSPESSIIIDSEVPIPVSGVKSSVIPEIEPAEGGGYRIVNNCRDRILIGHIEKDELTCHLTGRACADTYLLSSTIRVFVQFRVERHGGLFLHAACGSVKGKGVLFTGKSTAGKSTALRNLRPDTIIAEDAVALRVFGSTTKVYAIPFRGEVPSNTELDALFFPRKYSGPSRLTREAAAEVASEITANALFCAPSSEEIMSRTLETIALCSSIVPGYGCFFDKTTDLQAVFTAHGIFD